MSQASYGYGKGAPVLINVDLDIRKGDVVVIKGASASGKTTLAKAIAGFLSPDRGVVDRCGRVNLLVNKGLGLKPSLSLYDNAMIRYLNFNSSLSTSRRKVRNILSFAKLDDRSHAALSSLPSLLKSRFALCLYLLNSYGLLVIDENIGLSDPEFREEVDDIVRYLMEQSDALVAFSRKRTPFDAYSNRAFTIESGRLIAR